MEAVLGVLIGAVAGFASGVAGIGGGVIMIPAMVFLLDMGQTTAQGTSLLAIVFTSMSGTVVNLGNRRVDLRTGLIMGAGGVAAAQIGKTAALAVDADLLQRLFGLLVLVSGLRMGWRAWASMREARA